MIKFFRKIRYILMETGKTGKYFKYAIGEIHIKGLPRYLAIIQGFIGWLMLTIFSVSLIAQLLNQGYFKNTKAYISTY